VKLFSSNSCADHLLAYICPINEQQHAMNPNTTRKVSAAKIAKMDLMRRASYCPEARAALRAIYESKK
jgi:hypothetical protein